MSNAIPSHVLAGVGGGQATSTVNPYQVAPDANERIQKRVAEINTKIMECEALESVANRRNMIGIPELDPPAAAAFRAQARACWQSLGVTK